MKKFIFRILSFFLDLLFLSLVVGSIAEMPMFDGYNSDIDNIRKEALKSNDNYKKIDKEIDDILEDALVDNEEFNYIHTSFIEYRELFDEIKPNTNISKKYIDNIHDNIDKHYKDIYYDQLFRVATSARYQNVITIIVYILYFGVLQYVLKGQTIFKKLFKIRVVDNKDIKKRVPLWKFILRAVLVCNIIFTIIDLIAISNLGFDGYLSFNSVLGNIKSFYEIAFVLVILIRDDQRGIQDILLNTKVVRYNRFGKIQKDIIFKQPVEEEKEVKNKKIREEVKAIKVDD